MVAVHPISVRFRDEESVERLRKLAALLGQSASALAEELIEEGMRIRRHPLVTFRDGPAGRRAAIVGGPDVWEVIGGLIGGDVLPEKRVERAVDVFGLRPEQVKAALSYYAEYTDEIDDLIEANDEAAAEAEALWHRERELLAK
jgi:uncharacterized protein (DUF433 family)